MNTQLFLAGKEIDMTDVINIPLNKSFEDLSNPTNINNDFSKTIKIPVSVKNNEVLGNAFRLDKVIITNAGQKNIGKYLNPTKKIPFRLLNNGDLIMDGYAKLSFIDNSYNDRFYTLNLFGTLGDLFHKLLNCCFTTRFCPQLDVTEIYEDEDNKILFDYAIPYETNGVPANPITAAAAPNNYHWFDERYVMDDYLSGEKKVCAKTIKECWENVPSINKSSIDLDYIKEHKQDLSIVGFMPTHHGFPDGFNPKNYEYRDGQNSLTAQFVDTADQVKDPKNNDAQYDHSALVGDGLTEEQYQQFVSWQQKPYIYIKALFGMFQKHMDAHPDVFNGYRLTIDPKWTQTDIKGNFVNPYWSKLCYTLSFLFGSDDETTTEVREVTQPERDDEQSKEENDIWYYHDNDGDTSMLGLKSELNVNYTDDNVVSTITLDGYVCMSIPMFIGDPDYGPYVGYSDKSGELIDDGNACVYLDSNKIGERTNIPQLFYSHYHKYATKGLSAGEIGGIIADPIIGGIVSAVGKEDLCNGGYKVTIRVKDQNNNVVQTLTNVWSPEFLKGNKRYAKLLTNKLYEDVNGDIIDIIHEESDDKKAVLLPYTFKGFDVSNNKLKQKVLTSDDTDYWYIGIGFPLRSFGSIPVGVNKPKFEVEIMAMAEHYNDIDDAVDCSIGAYTWFDSLKNTSKPIMRGVQLNDYQHFRQETTWVKQNANNELFTMFYTQTDTNHKTVKFGQESKTSPNLDSWLKTDSGDKFETTSAYKAHGGNTWSNEYGRYWSMSYDIGKYTRFQNYLDTDLLLGVNDSEDVIKNNLHIGESINFNSTSNYINNHHSPVLKMSNLWTKEDSIFNVLIEYSKIYGLYWHVNPINKTINLLTKQSLFEDYTVEDWSNKVDRSKSFTITPILHTSKYLNFDYDDEKDAAHYTLYGDQHLVNYGGYRLKTGYDFTPEDEDLFKGVQSTCFSNRPLLTWKQIYNYSTKDLPYSIISPFNLMDADSKDGKKSIEIENWVFRNSNLKVFSNKDKESKAWNTKDDFICTIIDDSPTMTATQKYMYIDINDSDFYRTINDELGNKIGGLDIMEDCTSFPSFSIISDNYGCLFNRPNIDFTLPQVLANGDRSSKSQLKNIDVKWIYNWTWRRWMDERYNINNKKLTCYINLSNNEFYDISPRNIDDINNIYYNNFKIIDGQLFMLNKICDFNIADDGTTKCEFIQITDPEAYINEGQYDFETLTLTDVSPEQFVSITDDIVTLNVLDRTTHNPIYQNYLRDYKEYLLHKKDSPLKFNVLCSPKRDTEVWVSDMYKSNIIEYDTSWIKITEDDWDQDGNFKGDLFVLPYYTWFKSTDSADPRSFNIYASNDVNERHLQYDVRNIKPYFREEGASDAGVQGLVQVEKFIKEGHEEKFNFTFEDNLGLNIITDYISFYEVPIVAYKSASIDVETGEGAVEIFNILIPTYHHCVSSKNNGFGGTNFNRTNTVTVTSQPQYDSFLSNQIQAEMKRFLDNGYYKVELLKDKDDNFVPIRLFTTVVWHLDRTFNLYKDVSSENAAFNYLRLNNENTPMLYTSFTDNASRTDFSVDDMVYFATINQIHFGNGTSNIDNRGISNIVLQDLTLSDQQKFNYGKYSKLGIAPGQFYNNPGTSSSLTSPRIGRCRILDYYNTFGTVPYLLDLDTQGDDGYIYKTFYQDLWQHGEEPGQGFPGLIFIVNGESVDHIDQPKVCETNKDNIFPYDAFLLLDGQQFTDDLSITINTDYNENTNPYITSSNTPYVSEETKEIVIPTNTSGVERTITVTVTYGEGFSNSVTFYQATMDTSGLGGY